ncbi:Tol-Pal system protein TolB [Candidatus Trichorickettsia mobilis]|uniref:Tol-Pal system protein TolB n=1 Tax=Candidatus Trichorickettsia mobilis TaxID=1346319 RepID=A0ABZ0UW34_9RICK|nr:Tol-Pal system beta propeller repeat protein TolB [Candidatus Trichorickettsia mobilis]WPY01302.1 Tol-Pal system protein TolB [Candidatus Trichorickettsia mobilis]
MIRLFFSILLLIAFNSQAIETITINRGHADPIPVAINHFNADNSADNITGDNITNVIANDLKRSGLFKPISRAAFIEHKIGIEHKPLFVTWRQINANLLLNGEVTQGEHGKLKVSFILWDTVLEKDIVGEVFEVPANLWRRVAHKIADKIYEKVTGDKGYFDTRIAYVAETGTYLKRVKRIAVMDYDGANHQYLTDGKDLVLTPRFSPQADRLLYISYARKAPRIYMRNLKTGKDTIVGDFPGMSFAPRFNADGSKALMSIAKHGSTHIFSINFQTMRITQLTQGSSINTSPSYSPDNSKIVFNSDRSGSRQLYIMNADGTNIERISFGGGYYTAPSWSPRGDYIAFTKMTRGGGFTIGVMRPTTNPENVGERIIANGYLVEGPTWAGNGRVIMFAKGEPPRGNTAGKNRIYSIDLTGYNELEIPTPKDASDPDWSKTLH